MSGIEAAAGRTAATVGGKLFGKLRRDLRKKQIRDDSRAAVPAEVVARFLDDLGPGHTAALDRWLASPDFEEITFQFALWRLLDDRPVDEIAPTLREEVRLGLQHAGLPVELLTTGADVVFNALLVAVLDALRGFDSADVNPTTAAAVGHLAAAAARNTELLARVESVARFHEFGSRLRSQVAKMHGEMRMPHLGISRSVPYSRLYVQPSLDGLTDLTTSGRRSVVLGDPGAGKSTLAAKLAWEIASGDDDRVPFLVVLRNFTASFREGGKGLVSYLEALCEEPYNLTAPPDAIEYLLGNGRAVVILDGVDELVEPELRRRFARLVEGFAHLYPSVPLIVTARKIGYDHAPLDSRLFARGTIEEFDEPRVERYTRSWFALEESTPEHERAKLADAFLRESAAIEELRSNPLLLALLCAMFASEHYLPTNLADVYEKCAVMLFDQWDRMRGMPMPERFHGRLRSAVGYLAFQQFTAPTSGDAWPRSRIVRMLVRFLEGKGYEPDEAEQDAERFVDFCTGRPWVLTDTGSGAHEPQYGFTHRTFLEYFAAEHLVRTHRTPYLLWVALREKVHAGQWEVVAQIALQLLDDRYDEGASELLRLAVTESALDYAATALNHVHPTPDVTRLIVDAAVRLATSIPVTTRFGYWPPTRAPQIDWPLHKAVLGCSPGNRALVRKVALQRLREMVAEGDDAAELQLWRVHPALGITDAVRPEPWATIMSRTIDDLSPTLRRFGPRVLYLSTSMFDSPAVRALREHAVPLGPSELVAADLPWISAADWHDQVPHRSVIPGPVVSEHTAQHILLSLPYLETEGVDTQQMHWLVREIGEARASGNPMSLDDLPLPPDVREFVEKWMRREISVIG